MNPREQLSDDKTPSPPVVSRAAAPGDGTPSIPDHQLLRSIAAGAYGEVWLGLNAVGTPRAVKVVRPDQHASIESFEREFKGLQKFEPVSRAHEGLADILTLGLLPDRAGFYYVMELADDLPTEPGLAAALLSASSHPSLDTYRPRTLRADLKSRGALPGEEVVALGLKLCAALSYLHDQGLVHRDVKPSNILFIGGEPKLADARLVAPMDDARSLVGTAGWTFERNVLKERFQMFGDALFPAVCPPQLKYLAVPLHNSLGLTGRRPVPRGRLPQVPASNGFRFAHVNSLKLTSA